MDGASRGERLGRTSFPLSRPLIGDIQGRLGVRKPGRPLPEETGEVT
ncbi:hypothetical protein ACIQUM_07445 [Amycolatopsis azurea]